MQLLIDLDNTLIDRDGGFARWAEGYVEDLGGCRDDLDWLLAADAHGYAPRRVLADGLRERLHPSTAPEELVVQLMRGRLPFIEPYPGVVEELQRLRGAGIPTRSGPISEPGVVWMVGDHPEAGIAGGRAAGCSTGWVRHGRSWDEQERDSRPTVQAETTREVLQLIADGAVSAEHAVRTGGLERNRARR